MNHEYDSVLTAKYIADKCKDSHYTYNKTKIQKLLYCCYGCVLAIEDKRLCKEYPRAWQYGPVFPKLFGCFSKHNDINTSERLDPSGELKNILDGTILKFGKYTANDLSNWSHEEGSPWDTVVNVRKEGLGAFIADDLIKEYFKRYVIAAPT